MKKSEVRMKKYVEQNKNILTKMYQHLRCSICLHWLSSPLMTVCMHRFCSGCVGNAIKAMPPNKENNYHYPCPLCGQKISKRSLIKQEHLGELVEHLKSVVDRFEKKYNVKIVDEQVVFDASTASSTVTDESSNNIVVEEKKPMDKWAEIEKKLEKLHEEGEESPIGVRSGYKRLKVCDSDEEDGV